MSLFVNGEEKNKKAGKEYQQAIHSRQKHLTDPEGNRDIEQKDGYIKYRTQESDPGNGMKSS